MNYVSRYVLGLMVVALLAVGGWVQPRVAGAACAPLPTANGAAMFTVSAPGAGKYRFWAHIYVPSAGSNAVYLQVDETDCSITVGDSDAMAAGQFTWVDYQKGAASDKIDVNLSAGSHTIKLAGLDAGVGVDKVMFASDTACVPTGDGTNCVGAGNATGDATASASKAAVLSQSAAGNRSGPGGWFGQPLHVGLAMVGGLAVLGGGGYAFWRWRWAGRLLGAIIPHALPTAVVSAELPPVVMPGPVAPPGEVIHPSSAGAAAGPGMNTDAGTDTGAGTGTGPEVHH